MLATSRNLRPIRVLGAVAVLALVGLGAEPPGKTENVTISGTSYSPITVNIHVGDTVVWTNADDRDYTVVASDGSFNSGNINSGKTYERKFTKAGSFGYYCKYHPRMKGTVVVAAK
jgi:plastocyanin